MQADHQGNGSRSAATRSAVSNGSRKALFGDGRSAGARRYRDLLQEFAAEFGGLASLPATGQQKVRRLAQVSVELELLEATRAAGGAIDPVAFCTLVNTQRRLMRDLEALVQRIQAKPGPSLHEHMARNHGAQAAPEAA